MFISHKSNVLQQIHETEWQCRKNTKGMTKPEYWAWEETIKDSDGVPDYSGETGYTIVECTDEDVNARLSQLGDYINQNRGPEEALVYNIKWSDKKTKVTVNDIEIETHFTGDDSAKDARMLADKWANVRRDRNKKLAETDYLALSDNTLADNMKTYRQELRDVPKQSDPDNITWPTKP